MSTEADQYPYPRLNPAATLQPLQRETVWLVWPILAGAGALLIAGLVHFADPLHGVAIGLLLYLVVLTSWGLRQMSYLASTWAMVLGLVAVDLVLVGWTRIGPALSLLALPAGLAALSISLPSGVLVAAGCTVLLLSAPGIGGHDQALRVTSLITLWGVIGLTWMMLRPLVTILEWSWSSYEQSRSLLERARDTQVQLKQTLADLADANLQLTRLNQLAQSLRRAAEEAREARDQFVATVSHELRTPLNMIVGYTEMIMHAPKAYGNIPGPLLADLGVIMRNSQHLSALVSDVLEMSQIDAGRMALTRERASLAEIVQAAVDAVQPLFRTKGLYLETDLPEEATLVCDSTRIREVILNLLSNAGRFTEQGGVRIRAWREGSDMIVSVTDTGPGIAASDRDKLFRPFQQIGGSVRERYGGSGLGLYISRSLIELHGGQLWLDSEEGKGTTISFRLPIEPATHSDDRVSRWLSPHWQFRERTRPSLAQPPVLRPRYVIADSGNTLHKLLMRYLDSTELVPVGGLDEALAELARTPAQALVLNGPSVGENLQRIRGAGALLRNTPVIVCSLPSPGDANALRIAGYLVKPISRQALLAALDRLGLPSGTVLIVDDEPEAAQLFWRMLATADRSYRVLTAADGRQALDIMHREQPDALLLDLVMPGMDGFQVLEARSQDPLLREIPVIVISARDPTGEPIVGDTLAVSYAAGFSVPQLLTCIEGITATISPLAQAAGPAPPRGHPG